MSAVTRSTLAGVAYLDLQRQARQAGRLTAELFQLYALEGVLARLAASPARDHFVLKGGVLLAAFGNRRPTRDVDLSAVELRNDAATVLDLVRSVLTISLPEDDDWLPEQFSDVLGAVIAFAGPALTGQVDGQIWDPQAARWE